jgi:hypothetical protein
MEVSGTPFDFTDMKPIGAEISANDRQIMNAQGYDHNWILNKSEDSINKAAEVFDPESERIWRFIQQTGCSILYRKYIERFNNDMEREVLNIKNGTVCALKRSISRIQQSIPFPFTYTQGRTGIPPYYYI